jgi:transposase
MKKPTQYSPEVRERAVRMVFDHAEEYDSQWAAIQSIAEKIGCSSETLRNWLRQSERDHGSRPGVTSGCACRSWSEVGSQNSAERWF